MALAAVSERPTNEPNSPAEAASRPSGIGSLVLVARVHGIHLTSEQLIREHGLIGDEPSPMEILACARASGLKPKLLKLNWVKLEHLKKALPAILLLKNGSSMVLQRVEVDHEHAARHPAGPQRSRRCFARPRPRATGGSLGRRSDSVKRDYDIVDETKPFGFSFIVTLIFRERRLVRDVGIAALCVSILALAPIVFWRLMMDRVLNYHAANTLFVLCTVMVALVGFETAFASLRRYLILVLTTRVDVKLSTYLFDQDIESARRLLRAHFGWSRRARHERGLEDQEFSHRAVVRNRARRVGGLHLPAGHVFLQSSHDRDRRGGLRIDLWLDRR